ncbi:MAG: glycosyltransferase family 2 protein [Deltaproteobacteria bacterium]|nr:MAG: glycosyltransferase family 2 protein [Deltaproteobacteria bacterium]
MQVPIPMVYIILLNYNGWQDTLECLESLVRIDYPDYRVVVVDNGSTDKSIEYIKKWAEGDKDLEMHSREFTRYNSGPGLDKPIPYMLINAKHIDRFEDIPDKAKPYITIIDTGKNLGFAGGNNVGIRYAISRREYDYVWLLNNDTVVEKGALGALVEYSQRNKDAGIVGSKLLYYHRPDIIQSAGGRLNKWFASTSSIGQGQHDSFKWDKDAEVETIMGASFFISRECIERIGLLPEEYFLYMEETDYCYRARLHGFKIGFAHKSKVYHKEGSSTGCVPLKGGEGRSYEADILSIRNRLRFARKYLRPYLPTVYLGLLISTLIRIKRRQWRNALYIIRLLLGIER